MAIVAAFALLAALAAVVLAIDVGRLYWAKRELQKQAVIAALDATRLVGGCSVDDTAPVETDPAVLTAEIQTLVDQILATSGLGETIRRRVDGNGQPAGVDLGVIQTDAQGQRRLASTSSEPPDAVRVTLERPFPTPILPLWPTRSDRLMVASATAEQAALGSFYVGSGLLSLNEGMLNALLSGLLGGNVNLRLVDYTGLAGVGVSLADLAIAIGLEVQDLSDPLVLDTQTPLLSDTIDGLADALSGQVSGAVTGLLRQLAAVARAGADATVPLGALFGPVGDTAADVPMVNLLDLLIALGAATHADAGGGVAPIRLPVGISIPGVSSLQVFLQVLEPPRFSGMGRAGIARAESAQIRLMVRLQVNALNTVSNALTLLLGGGLLGQVTVTPLNLGIDLEVAKAEAFLDRIRCPRSADPTLATELSARPAVAQLRLGTFSGSPATAPAITQGSAQLLGTTIKLLGGLISTIQVNLFLENAVTTTAGSGAARPLPHAVTEFTRIEDATQVPYWQAEGVPPDAPAADNPQTVGTTNILGGALSSLFASARITATDPAHPDASSSICLLKVLNVCTLSIPVGSLLNAVLNPVVALLGSILSPTGALVDSLLDPLLDMLGIDVGSATVTMNTVTVDTPRLVTTALP
ncbi:hypothetical protein [Fontimonas thermophila]|uniref:hypothetical protein n=1 Tax=Fontimonas thermophila TaxID=1076937 RepID=UPI000B83704B|nr:hypothetical protein [Fontimonas thermophila]